MEANGQTIRCAVPTLTCGRHLALLLQPCQGGTASQRGEDKGLFHSVQCHVCRGVNLPATLLFKDFFPIPCFYCCEGTFVWWDWPQTLARVQGGWVCIARRGFLSPECIEINYCWHLKDFCKVAIVIASHPHPWVPQQQAGFPVVHSLVQTVSHRQKYLHPAVFSLCPHET